MLDQSDQDNSILVTPKKRLQRWQKITLWVMAPSIGIWFYYFKSPAWYEEVQLSDGSKITIRQSLDDMQTISGGIGEGVSIFGFDGQRYANKYQIDANDKLGIKTPWIGLYGNPVVMDRSTQGYWYVISTFVMCEKYMDFIRFRLGSNWLEKIPPKALADALAIQRQFPLTKIWDQSLYQYAPKQFYIEYRYINDQWVIQDEVDQVHQDKLANLRVDVSGRFEGFYFSAEGKRGHYEGVTFKSRPHFIKLDYKNNC